MKKVIAQDGQSFLDLCVQASGSADGLFEFCDANNVDPDDVPSPGTEYLIPAFSSSNSEVMKVIVSEQIIPVTLGDGQLNEGTNTDAPEGIDYWVIENDFIVQPD